MGATLYRGEYRLVGNSLKYLNISSSMETTIVYLPHIARPLLLSVYGQLGGIQVAKNGLPVTSESIDLILIGLEAGDVI
jgi:hypothetical protein